MIRASENVSSGIIHLLNKYLRAPALQMSVRVCGIAVESVDPGARLPESNSGSAVC